MDDVWSSDSNFAKSLHHHHELAETTFEEDHDLFSIFESLENVTDFRPPAMLPLGSSVCFPKRSFSPLTSNYSSSFLVSSRERETTALIESKKPKTASTVASTILEEAIPDNGQHRTSHINLERNRRKKMKQHLAVLRCMVPCFYIKRGDQASIIGGVVDYIHELQQVLQTMEAKKQRKAYGEVLRPRLVFSARSISVSPRKPAPRSPRASIPISPRTPQRISPYKPWLKQSYPSRRFSNSLGPCFTSPSSSSRPTIYKFRGNPIATSKSAVADIEIKFSGPNVILKTLSPQIPRQAMKIISALEELSLEILHASISSKEETMINYFTIKIGVECLLTAEELAQQVQHAFY